MSVVDLPCPAMSTMTSPPMSAPVPEAAAMSDADLAELRDLVRGRRQTRQPVRVKVPGEPGNDTASDALVTMLDTLKVQRAFGAVSVEPVNARIGELREYLAAAGLEGIEHLNAALAFIDGMAPEDQAEAMLLAQMYVTHHAAMRTAARYAEAELLPHAQTFGNLAVKFMRASQAQMETLARMRRGGEQVVRHIHVDNRGGQAVIAETVQTGGTHNGKSANQVHGQSPCGPALPGQDAFGHALPMPSHSGPETLPHPWGAFDGCAQG